MTPISNNEIKKVKSLQQKKFRDETGLFTVEGEKMVDEAVASPFFVESVYRRDEIGEEAMKRISSLSSPSPALAVVRKPEDVYVDDDAWWRRHLVGARIGRCADNSDYGVTAFYTGRRHIYADVLRCCAAVGYDVPSSGLVWTDI